MLDATFMQPLLLTLKVAGLATLMSFVLGVLGAFLLSHHKFPGRDFLDAALTLPLVMPPTVLGYYLLVIIGRRGIIGEWLYNTFGISIMFTWQGAVLAAAVVSFPMVFKSARAALEDVGINHQNAARTLGSSEFTVFLRVSFPMAFRGILAGTMLAFARAMGEFGATLMVAGNMPGKTQTLSLAVYSAVQAGQDSLANWLVLVISVVCVVILFSANKFLTPR